MSERRKVLEQFELQKDFMQQPVAANIEKYRKGDAAVTLTDETGAPVANADIRVNQTGHEFRFGANLFMLDEMETPEKNEKYKQIFAGTFNMATLPFYWSATEPEEGKHRLEIGSERMYRRPPIDLCLAFCEEHGIEPREHGLAYEQWAPEWLYGADIPTTKAALENRFRELSKRYAHRIPTIEVTNEMYWKSGRTAFYDSPDYVAWCFKLAEKYFPNNELVVNETTRFTWEGCARPTDPYYSYVESSILKGARIDAIGMQFHGFLKRENEYEGTRQRYDPKEVYRHMDLYAQLADRLQVTEVTFPAYSWTDEDEQIQAELLENMYSIWFSHPNMEQIIYWNLVDGYAHLWRVDEETLRKSLGNMTIGENYYHGGLFRHDFTPKPAWFKLKQLLEKTWHTEEALCTDQNGRIRFRGFYGDYEAVLPDGRKANFKLSSKDDNKLTLTLG